MTKKLEELCNHCGGCCKVKVEGEWIDCQFRENGKCSVYEDRLGRAIGWGFFCRPRECGGYDVPGCPYNSGYEWHESLR